MTKIQAYQWLVDRDPRGLGWIANVFFTRGGPHSAANIKAMVALINAGVEIAPMSFTMPYDGLLIDGAYRTPAEMRAMAKGLNP